MIKKPMWIKKSWVIHSPAHLVIGLFGLFLFIGGGWEAFAKGSSNLGAHAVEIDLTGEWEIQEEDKAYQVTLDAEGNGLYNWQEGRLQTNQVVDRLWSGTWHQKGNDREGGFEVILSEDGKTADGEWWYLRVGSQKTIPPRDWGGSYKIIRLPPQGTNK